MQFVVVMNGKPFGKVNNKILQKQIDLRSDTVTRPSAIMRTAIANAAVGDDVLGDDQTVKLLEQIASDRVGKECGLFVPSGTMANLIAVLCHTKPGDEIILGTESHIFNYEVAGASRIAGVQVYPIPNLSTGNVDLLDLKAAIREKDIHTPTSTLLCLENTHNRCGGTVISAEAISQNCEIAHENGLSVHLDGARIFNAEVALKESASSIAKNCDSVAFCFSKGLGSPIGSIICGSRYFIEQARRHRKMLGGGMRQVGVLAAAAIYALENNVNRLVDDHTNAATLARELQKINDFEVVFPETNIIVVTILRGIRDTWINLLLKEGVLVSSFGRDRLRLVTHLDFQNTEIDFVIKKIKKVALLI